MVSLRPRRKAPLARGTAVAALGLAIACAEPAALDVVVDVNASSLEDIRLLVRQGGLDGEAFVDCRLPNGAAAAGACGLEGGTGGWTEPERLSFVLFGDPGTAVGIELDGFRDGRSVTATRAEARLPARDAERRTLPLALFDRTEERYRCAVDLAPAPGALETSAEAADQTALAIADVVPTTPGLEPLLAVDGDLIAAVFSRGDDACSLRTLVLRDPEADISDPFDDDRWCLVQPGSLAVGASDIDGARVLASLCARSVSGGARLKVAMLAGVAIDVRTIDLGVPLTQVSMPALADLDGDGALEVHTLVQEAVDGGGGTVRVLSAEPRTGRSAVSTIGVFGAIAVGQPALPPMVVDGPGGGQRLLIAGYAGPVGVFDGADFQRLVSAGTRGSRGPVVLQAADSEALLQEVRGRTIVSTLIMPGAGGGFVASVTGTAAVPQPILPEPSVRLSVGVSDDLRAVISLLHDGTALGWTLQPTIAIRERTGAGPPGSEALLLHVNLDGEPGTEWVTYARDSSTVRAIDAAGRPLVGWPLTLTGESGTRRVALTDLEALTRPDSRALRSAEVVALTYRRFEVITLGAGSYDQAQWPWPSVDGGGRSGWSAATDPFRD